MRRGTDRRGGVRLAAAALALAAAAAGCGGADGGDAEGGDDPLAGGSAARGEELFAANCAQCHGADLRGTDQGPPLIHEYYVPSHHGDEAFLVAVQRGVQPHHWEFGPMPPVPSLGVEDVADIVAHVRARQRDAGLIE